jgi:hypothetical protein
VRRYGRCHHHRVERVVGEQLVEARGRARVRVARRDGSEPLVVEVAQPREVGQFVEVAYEVRAPVVETDDADPRGD